MTARMFLVGWLAYWSGAAFTARELLTKPSPGGEPLGWATVFIILMMVYPTAALAFYAGRESRP